LIEHATPQQLQQLHNNLDELVSGEGTFQLRRVGFQPQIMNDFGALQNVRLCRDEDNLAKPTL
jgi:hypothetical protein